MMKIVLMNCGALRKYSASRLTRMTRNVLWAVIIMACCSGDFGGPIHEAAELGRLDRVKALLLQDPKPIDTVDAKGRPVLARAGHCGKQDETLLNAKDQGGKAALHWAAMFDKSEVVTVLLTNKADLTIMVPKCGWTPLRLAVLHGPMATAKALLNGSAGANARDDVNIPLLHQAVIRGRKEMVELLLASQAEINYKDPEGETAWPRQQDKAKGKSWIS